MCLADSSAIIHYLEAKHPEPALIPADPKERGRTIWFDEFADTILFACGGHDLFQPHRRAALPQARRRSCRRRMRPSGSTLPPLLDYLEGVIPESGFLVGDRLTLADLAVASPFANLAHCGVAIDAGRYPKVTRYIEAILCAAELRRVGRARSRLPRADRACTKRAALQ